MLPIHRAVSEHYLHSQTELIAATSVFCIALLFHLLHTFLTFYTDICPPLDCELVESRNHVGLESQLPAAEHQKMLMNQIEMIE